MEFKWDAHAGFFWRSLLQPGLPLQYTTADTQRVTLAYFCVNALDLLGKLDAYSEADKKTVKEWLLAQQVPPGGSGAGLQRCGFRGGSFGGKLFKPRQVANVSTSDGSPNVGLSAAQSEDEMDEGNLAMTYSALATLVALEADLADVDGEAIVKALKLLQQEDGSFRASPSDSTCDLRFTYCACAVSTILGNWSGVNRQKAAEYIERCYDFDGGIGLAPGRESCAGPTFCAVASMQLMGNLNMLCNQRRHGLLEWCVKRQDEGFQGRPNKPVDCCCSFWVGATLALLGGLHLVDKARARLFHLSCQNSILGGFSKVPGVPPDLLHSFYSLCWLSLSGETGVGEMDVALGITRRAAAWLASRVHVPAPC